MLLFCLPCHLDYGSGLQANHQCSSQCDKLSLWSVTVATSNDSEKDPARNRGEAPQVSQHQPPEDQARGAVVSVPWLHPPWPRGPARGGGLHRGRADTDRQWARWVGGTGSSFLPRTLLTKCLCTSTSGGGHSCFPYFHLIRSGMTQLGGQSCKRGCPLSLSVLMFFWGFSWFLLCFGALGGSV